MHGNRNILPLGILPLSLLVLDAFLTLCCVEDLGEGSDCVDFARLFISCRKLQWSPFDHCPVAFHCQQSPRVLCPRCVVPWYEQPSKRSKKNGDKSAVAMLKKYELYDRTGKPVVCRDTRHERHGPVVCNSSNTRHLVCVFQDMEPPKFSSILRKSSDMQKPIQRVKFTKAVASHTEIRDENFLLGMICPGDPHLRSPNAPTFEDRFQEETEWQEQGAREAAWRLAKSVLKLKEKNKAAFFSPSENRCLPASTLQPEEREFVVDSGASMHMISKKDLNDAELDTLTKSCSPTIVITANGEVQTHEEATVYVKELEIFLTMKVLEKHASSIVAWKSFAMKTDTLLNELTVKNHISF